MFLLELVIVACLAHLQAGQDPPAEFSSALAPRTQTLRAGSTSLAIEFESVTTRQMA